MHAPQILIIEDHEIAASAIAIIVKENVLNVTVFQTATFTEGMEILHSGIVADLIILDMNIPEGESYDMIGKLRNIQDNVRILIYTAYDYKQHALGFLNEGANGFLSKNAPIQEIGIAIKQILNNERYITEDVQREMTDRFPDNSNVINILEQTVLSPQETEVLELLMKGKGIKDIALDLNLKLTTVSMHRTTIFEKMQVTNIIELFKKVRLGEEV